MRRAVEWFLRDLRFSVRAWRRAPGATVLITLTLAVGLACNVAAFSLVRTLLLRPYPFPDLERLVLLRESRAGDSTLLTRLATADLRDLRRETTWFDGIAFYRYLPLTLITPMEPVPVRGFAVSTTFFHMLGTSAAYGRTLMPADEEEGGDHNVVLSHGLWQRQFGADPRVLGRDVVVGGRVYTVVGVMPTWFNFPRGAELWIPLSLTTAEEQDRVSPMLSALARIRAGRTVDQATAELTEYARTLAARHPLTNTGRQVRLLPLREEQYEYTLPFFAMLEIAALFVFAVAGANAGSLFLTERMARRRELAMRMVLGATRHRLIASTIAEAVAFAAMGAAVAVPFSWWAVRAIRETMPRGIATFVAGWDALEVDVVVMGVSMALALIAGLGVGAVAAIQLPTPPSGVLTDRAAISWTSPRHLRRVAVGLQLGVALVLLSVGVSLLSGFRELSRVYDAHDPDGVLLLRITLPAERYSTAVLQADFLARTIEAMRALPSVDEVATVSNVPASNVPNARTSFAIEQRTARLPADIPSADLQVVGGAFFPLLRVPVLSGRDLLESDVGGSMPVVVISQAMAQQHWPNESPLGHRIRLGSSDAHGPWWTIVGVVGNVKQNWFDPMPRPIIYVPVGQRPARTMSLLARTAHDPSALAGPMRAALKRLDQAQALPEIITLREEVDDSLAPIRIIGTLLMIFAGVTLALAAIGVYGVVASTVIHQTREAGVRMAVGASPSRLLTDLLRDALRVACGSIAIALPLALGLHTMLGAWIYNLVAADLVTLAGLTLFLLVVTVVGAFIPAWRAASVDPAMALRAL